MTANAINPMNNVAMVYARSMGFMFREENLATTQK